MLQFTNVQISSPFAYAFTPHHESISVVLWLCDFKRILSIWSENSTYFCCDWRHYHSFPSFSACQYHLRKLEGRRLDLDYKKRRKGKVSDSEMNIALEKFEESKELAERSMFNLLERDVS